MFIFFDKEMQRVTFLFSYSYTFIHVHVIYHMNIRIIIVCICILQDKESKSFVKNSESNMEGMVVHSIVFLKCRFLLWSCYNPNFFGLFFFSLRI